MWGQRQVCLARARPRNCTSASDVSCHIWAGCHLRAAALPRDRGTEGHLPRHILSPTPYLLPTPPRAYLLPIMSRPPSRHQTEDGKTANTARPLPPTSHARALRRTRSARHGGEHQGGTDVRHGRGRHGRGRHARERQGGTHVSDNRVQ
jgi:hypothetical protein